MKWFYRWLSKKLQDSDYHQEKLGHNISSGSVVARDDAAWGDGLRVNIKKVIGGYVVTFYRFNRKTEYTEDRHYIITDDSNFNDELGKLISLEAIRG